MVKKSQISFNEPLKVKNLNCYRYYDWIVRLSSTLKVLTMHRFIDGQDDFLISLTSLECLDVYKIKENALIKLAKESLQILNLTLFYRGVPIETNESINEILNFIAINHRPLYQFNDQIINFYIKYQTRCRLELYREIRISDKFNAFEYEFFKKFSFVVSVYVNQGKLREDELILILKNMPNFCDLIFNFVDLTQSFYDQIPLSHPSLIRLHIEHSRVFMLNEKFTGRLSRLCFFVMFNFIPDSSDLKLTDATYENRKDFFNLI